MALKYPLGLFVPGIYFIVLSLISIMIFISQEIVSPVLIFIIILGVVSGVSVMIRNRAGMYLAAISTPIVLTVFFSSAYYSIKMFGSNETVFLGYQSALIILAVLWFIMSIVVVDNRDKFKK